MHICRHTMQDAGDEGAPKARPWERGDLVRRLRSFRPATWFCKPAPAGPIECARRGWVNAGQDLLSCEVRLGPSLVVGVYNRERVPPDVATLMCKGYAVPLPCRGKLLHCRWNRTDAVLDKWFHVHAQFCKAKLALTLPVTLSREETDKVSHAPALHTDSVLQLSACICSTFAVHRHCSPWLTLTCRPRRHLWSSWPANTRATAPGAPRPVLPSWQPFPRSPLRRCAVQSCGLLPWL
jgi:hypothetical protein